MKQSHVSYLIIADRQCSNVLHLVTRVCVRSGSTCGTSPSGRTSVSEFWEDLVATETIQIMEYWQLVLIFIRLTDTK